MTAFFYIGDALSVLKNLEAGSVDLVITSPPFLALRSYLPADHPDKALEMGSEPDPGTYVDALIEVVEECRRVLAPHGSLCVELGDTYSGSGGGGGDYLGGGFREGQPGFGGSAEKQRQGNAAHWRQKNQAGAVWPLAKSLALIPETVRFTLAYGRNPHTGRQTEPWRIRNVIRWVRPNPPVGALGDKFRPATSEMLVACTSSKRFFDLDAVREPHKSDPAKFTGNGYGKGQPEGLGYTVSEPGNPAGAPPLDWWNIPTHPYRGAHYATFPPELVIKPVKSMCPEKVCRECGEPSRRIATNERVLSDGSIATTDFMGGERNHGLNQKAATIKGWSHNNRETLGWTCCGCGDGCATEETVMGAWPSDIAAYEQVCDGSHWRPGLVLDPFAGTGTVLQVATGHSRNAIGIDLDERNAVLALERVGPLLLEIVDCMERNTAAVTCEREGFV